MIFPFEAFDNNKKHSYYVINKILYFSLLCYLISSCFSFYLFLTTNVFLTVINTLHLYLYNYCNMKYILLNLIIFKRKNMLNFR